MAEVWTLSEESIRKLAKLVSAQERELGNLRRHLAHYSTRRHEAVYLPGKSGEIVQVMHDGEAQYAAVAANADGVHPGRVRRVVDGEMETKDDCWILFVDQFDTLAGNVAVYNEDYYGPARLSDRYTSQGLDLPLYVVRFGEQLPTEIVEVYHSSADPGDIVEANASGYHPGRIRRYSGTDTYDIGDEIWIQFADGFDGAPNDDGNILACNGENYGPAKLAGEWDKITNPGEESETHDKRPVYVVECSERQFLCKADSSISKGGSGTVSLYNSHDEADSGINRTAKALFAAIATSKWCIYHRIAGVWYVSKAEC